MTYDQECYELAVYFLPDGLSDDKLAAKADALAQVIQSAIEDWLEENGL